MNKVAIIGVPSQLGAGHICASAGPEAVRRAQLQGKLEQLRYQVIDMGDVRLPDYHLLIEGNPSSRYEGAIVHLSKGVNSAVARALQNGDLPLVIGGDHTISLGSVAASARRYSNIGLLWLDAHGDFNTPETSPSGNVHGMVLACLVGLGPPQLARIDGFVPVTPERCVLVGTRRLDPGERELLRSSGVKMFTMRDIFRHGIEEVIHRAIDAATEGGKRMLHVSLDMDVVDPHYAPGVTTPHEGGLRDDEIRLAMRIIGKSRLLVCMDVAEIDPIQDIKNMTAKLAVKLVTAAMPKGADWA